MTKEDRVRAEAAFKQATAEEAKAKTMRDVQEEEALALREKTGRLRAMRLAKEAADAEAGIIKQHGCESTAPGGYT